MEAWADLTMESAATNRGSAEAAALSKSPVWEQRRQEHDSGSNKQKLFHGAPPSSVLSQEPYYTNPDAANEINGNRLDRHRRRRKTNKDRHALGPYAGDFGLRDNPVMTCVTIGDIGR
jgi:hypothetical protein